jgi:hypothetical protein
VQVQTIWSVKGGSGATVVAAAIAVGAARRGPTTLVDLCGDAPAVLGLAEPDGPGVRDWLAAPASGADALERLLVPVTNDLALLPQGSPRVEPWTPSRGAALADALDALRCRVVVDAGRCGSPSEAACQQDLIGELARRGTSLLVTRACYLSLRRAVRSELRPDGAVLVAEPGRSLDATAVADVLGVPVTTRVDVDPAVARAVDAGLLARRTPRQLARAVAPLW